VVPRSGGSSCGPSGRRPAHAECAQFQCIRFYADWGEYDVRITGRGYQVGRRRREQAVPVCGWLNHPTSSRVNHDFAWMAAINFAPPLEGTSRAGRRRAWRSGVLSAGIPASRPAPPGRTIDSIQSFSFTTLGPYSVPDLVLHRHPTAARRREGTRDVLPPSVRGPSSPTPCRRSDRLRHHPRVRPRLLYWLWRRTNSRSRWLDEGLNDTGHAHDARAVQESVPTRHS